MRGDLIKQLSSMVLVIAMSSVVIVHSPKVLTVV